MKVNVFMSIAGTDDSEDAILEFSQIPKVGEYFALSTEHGATWYEVFGVLHFPVGQEYDAQIYAIEADGLKVRLSYMDANLERWTKRSQVK